LELFCYSTLCRRKDQNPKRSYKVAMQRFWAVKQNDPKNYHISKISSYIFFSEPLLKNSKITNFNPLKIYDDHGEALQYREYQFPEQIPQPHHFNIPACALGINQYFNFWGWSVMSVIINKSTLIQNMFHYFYFLFVKCCGFFTESFVGPC